MCWEQKDEREVIGTCASCGEPIYAGDAIREDEGHMIHDEEECLKEWIKTNWSIREICDACGIEEVA